MSDSAKVTEPRLHAREFGHKAHTLNRPSTALAQRIPFGTMDHGRPISVSGMGWAPRGRGKSGKRVLLKTKARKQFLRDWPTDMGDHRLR